jgi:aspartate racemase
VLGWPGNSEALEAMKVIGILGGASDQATAVYYRLINKAVNDRLGGWSTGEIVINSVNFARIEHFVRNDLWDEAGAYLADKTAAIERAGADLLLCVSNTLHRVADTFMKGLHIPFVHIVDPTASAIKSAGLRRVALLGTRPVMATDFLQRRYREKFGIDILVPDESEQVLVDRIIFDELCKGVIKRDSKSAYLGIVERMQARGAAGVILGCTEIPLLISQPDLPDVPMFDTTALHAERAVALALDA